MKLLRATLVCSLIFLVLLFVYCRFSDMMRNDGEGGPIFHRYVGKGTTVSDKFLTEVIVQLEANGFSPSAAPEGWVNSGEVYWFKGSYQGSLPFYLRLERAAPPADSFDLSYTWNIPVWRNARQKMHMVTEELSKELNPWAKAHGALSGEELAQH